MLLKVCTKNPRPNMETAKKRKTLVLGKQSESDPDSAISFKLVEFSQEPARYKLAKMIIVDELPFKYADNFGFKELKGTSQTGFKIPSRITVAKNCMQFFIEEKVRLHSLLSMNYQMVSLTTDTWTSTEKLNYLCVTAHFIDERWELNRKILSFSLIGDHTGETIGKALEKCIKEWGITKICTVTVDNATANNTTLAYLGRSMTDWNGCTLLGGDYMHLLCCGHILNLIVCDEMKEIDCSIGKIRASCKYVMSSPARMDCFEKCVQEANLNFKQFLVLDVPTRWNSTYLMLEAAEKYEKAFSHLEYVDKSFVHALDVEGGPPNSNDWKRARVFMDFLKIFYDSTLTFSGSLHVTANRFLTKLGGIQYALVKWMRMDDLVLKTMAENMKANFDKYLDIDSGNINYLLVVAVFLDPRFKWFSIEFYLNRVYTEERTRDMLKKLKTFVHKLYDQYVEWYPVPPIDSCNVSGSETHVTQSSDDAGGMAYTFEEEYRLFELRELQAELEKDELERYVEDMREHKYPGFDILNWWRKNTRRYYVLSRMARDILAIPVSTSSEFAFSNTGCVLDPYCSSLSPNTVEALICAQNWLKPTVNACCPDPQSVYVLE